MKKIGLDYKEKIVLCSVLFYDTKENIGRSTFTIFIMLKWGTKMCFLLLVMKSFSMVFKYLKYSLKP